MQSACSTLAEMIEEPQYCLKIGIWRKYWLRRKTVSILTNKYILTETNPIGMLINRHALCYAISLFIAGPESANAFRNCNVGDGTAWSATTEFRVGELVFNDATGSASGRETIYIFSNTYGEGLGECHVTYELSGSYVAGVDFFVLDGVRSSHSNACPRNILEAQYPLDLRFSIQMERQQDGSLVVNSASNESYIAHGNWKEGSAYYKTEERCKIF